MGSFSSGLNCFFGVRDLEVLTGVGNSVVHPSKRRSLLSPGAYEQCEFFFNDATNSFKLDILGKKRRGTGRVFFVWIMI